MAQRRDHRCVVTGLIDIRKLGRLGDSPGLSVKSGKVHNCIVINSDVSYFACNVQRSLMLS